MSAVCEVILFSILQYPMCLVDNITCVYNPLYLSASIHYTYIHLRNRQCTSSIKTLHNHYSASDLLAIR